LHSKASQLKKKKKPETKSCKFEVPGVEIGGEVDEGLEAKFLEQIGFVNGKGVVLLDSAPLRGLGL
jgi:hypothetical protein